MILGFQDEEIVKLAVDHQSEMTDGVVQYDYTTGEIYGASFSTGETENPENKVIEVFRLSQGERGVIDCRCDDCPFKNEEARYDGWEKEYPKTIEECCMETYIDNDFTEDFYDNYSEEVERQIREVLEDYLGETLDKLDDLRIEISDIITPHNYFKVRDDAWKMRVMDNYVDLALEDGFTTSASTPIGYLDAEVSHICTGEYDCESNTDYEKVAGAIALLSDGKLDDALESIREKKVDKKTTIQVNKSTRDALASIGGKDDSFDTIINKLIKNYGGE